MKKILYIGGFNLPDKNAAAQRVIANSKALRDIGYEITLLGLGKRKNSLQYENFHCINLKYPQTIKEWGNYLFSIKDLKPFIEDENPTIIIAYNYPSVALSKLVKFCNKNNIKIIADATEWYEAKGNIMFKLLKNWDTQKRMTDVHLKMDGVISISRYLYNYYLSKGIKSLLLPPLVDVKSKKWEYREQNRSDNNIILTYAGSPSKSHKDKLDVVVKAITKLNDYSNIRMNLIGMEKSHFVSLYNYSDEIPSFVHFWGRIPHNEVIKVLKNSDFQIFVRDDTLSTRAGFPTKFAESITAGVPVLTNLTSNIVDYLEEGVNGYALDTSSNESLTNSLIKILSLPQERIYKMKKIIKREQFDYRGYIPQIKDFIDSISPVSLKKR